MKVAKNQLTARQRQFCHMYAGPAKHNAALAARMAGYAEASSHVTGCKLLGIKKIAATVRGLEERVAVDMGYTRERLITELLEAVNMGRTMSLPSVMVSGLVAIGKAAGLDKPKANTVALITGQDVRMNRYSAMTDQELSAIISQGLPESLQAS